MFKCFTCDFTCHDNKILLLHVELSHKLLTEFSCEENNCCRIYQFFDSYEKHRLLKHANDLSSGETKCIENDTKEIASNYSPTQDFDSNEDISYSDSDSSSEDEDEILYDCEESQKLDDWISNTFAQESRLFVAKLYKFPNIPRTRANYIISDTNLLFKNSIQAIQNEIKEKGC